MTRQTRPFARARARSSSKVRRLRSPVRGSVTAAFSRWASLASAPARWRRWSMRSSMQQRPEQQEARRERGERELPGAILRSPQAGERGLRPRRAPSREMRCSELRVRASASRCARVAALAGGRARATRSAASACAGRAHGRGGRKAIEPGGRARDCAAVASETVVAAASSDALVSATCSVCTCEEALPDPPEVAFCAQIEIPVIPASSATIAMATVRSARRSRPPLVNPQSRATPRSSAGTTQNCGGSASLGRGTLPLKLGMPSAENRSCASWFLYAGRRGAGRLRHRCSGGRAGLLHDERDAGLRRREHPRRLPGAVPEVGRRATACPGSCWPRSARSSRATVATRAPTSLTRAECSVRCSSRPARTRRRVA